jgi:hypothetical protein
MTLHPIPSGFLYLEANFPNFFSVFLVLMDFRSLGMHLYMKNPNFAHVFFYKVKNLIRYWR